jgi:hypothetical protein
MNGIRKELSVLTEIKRDENNVTGISGSNSDMDRRFRFKL